MARRQVSGRLRSLLGRKARLERLLEAEGMKYPADAERFRRLGAAYCRVLEEIGAVDAGE
jgi:hypothetical protein